MSERTSRLQAAINAYRARLEKLDATALMALERAYAPGRETILATIDALVVEIEQAGGDLTPGQAARLSRARELLRLIEAETTRLARTAGQVIPDAQQAAITQAMERAEALAVAQAPDAAAAAELARQWTGLNRGAVENLVGQLSDGSPLNDWLRDLGGQAASEMERVLLDGITRGLSPRTVGNALARTANMPVRRMQAFARTAMMDSFRSASLATFAENDDILAGWQWSSHHGDRTCLACLARDDGTVYPLSVQFMPSHISCRCSPTPKLQDDDDMPPIETGVEWFDKQPQAVKDRMVPVSLRDDFKRGTVRLQDMATLQRNDTYGDRWRQATVTEAKANAKARKAGTQRTPKPTPPAQTPPVAPASPVAPTRPVIKDEASARAYFESIGVQVREFGGSKKTWQAVADVFADEVAAGYPVPPRMAFVKKGGNTVAAYVQSFDPRSRIVVDDQLNIYTRSKFWANTDAVSNTMDGYLAVPNTRGVVTHEIGHWRHAQNVTGDIYGFTLTNNRTGELFEERFTYESAEQKTANRVSQYAATKRSEFVAEVYSGLRNGKTYDDEVMAMYQQLGGPDV